MPIQETNISHLGKEKIILRNALVGDIWVPWRVYKSQVFPGKGEIGFAPNLTHISTDKLLKEHNYANSNR